ncbi:MAG: TadE/TadG family type IV pilus assembly protein [Magnetospiraceae bacterium]
MRNKLDQVLSHFRRNRRGSVAIEASVAIPVLIIAVLGMVDFGLYIRDQIELEQAARAGGQYALLDSSDEDAITAAVTGATEMSIPDGGITISSSCECVDDNSAVACDGSCATGSMREYLTITATAPYDPIFLDLPYFSEGMQVTGNVTFQVR